MAWLPGGRLAVVGIEDWHGLVVVLDVHADLQTDLAAVEAQSRLACFSRAWAKTGKRIAASIAIIAMTTEQLDEGEAVAVVLKSWYPALSGGPAAMPPDGPGS